MLSCIFSALFRDTSLAYIYGINGQNGHFWPYGGKILRLMEGQSYSKNKNSSEISEQNGTTCRYVQVKKRKNPNKNPPTSRPCQPALGWDIFCRLVHLQSPSVLKPCSSSVWLTRRLGSGGRVETPRHTSLVGEKSLINVKKWSCEKLPTKVIFVCLLR